MKRRTLLGNAAALAAVAAAPASAQETLGENAIRGAGSTFAFPIISRWSKGYERWQAAGGEFPVANAGLDSPPPNSRVDYEPIGSLAGTMRVKDHAVDFGASDVPMGSEDLQKFGLGQFPIVIGGVVTVVNLDGIGPGQIRFTGELLADIFLGKVQNWNDPAIRTINPDLKLPDAKIAVVRRSDGSGTTFNFTDYLSKVSPEWKSKVGSDLLVTWPTGTGARGNEGVAQSVRQTRNSIGYIEYAQALQSKLSYAAIRNRAGKFVTPAPASFQAAADTADWAKASDFQLMLTDTADAEAYPIVATVFVLMDKTRSPRSTRATFEFFRWSLGYGAAEAAELGYVPLPRSLVVRVKDYWTKTFRTAA